MSEANNLLASEAFPAIDLNPFACKQAPTATVGQRLRIRVLNRPRYEPKKGPVAMRQALLKFGTTEWIRTTDPHHVKVVL